MNSCFENNPRYHSNKRIIDAYLYQTEQVATGVQKRRETLLAILSAILSVLCNQTAVRVYRALGVTLSLVCMVGIIGAMESGNLGLFAGLLLGALAVGVEYLCLRPRRQRS
jgi:hypothetical protein